RLLTGAAALLPAFAGARSRQPPAAGEEVAAPLLAVVYTGQVDPALCLDSEKYDGVRARPSPSQLPPRIGAGELRQDLAARSGRRRAVARSRSLRRALSDRAQGRAARDRMGARALYGVRDARRERPLRRASRSAAKAERDGGRRRRGLDAASRVGTHAQR